MQVVTPSHMKDFKSDFLTLLYSKGWRTLHQSSSRANVPPSLCPGILSKVGLLDLTCQASLRQGQRLKGGARTNKIHSGPKGSQGARALSGHETEHGDECNSTTTGDSRSAAKMDVHIARWSAYRNKPHSPESSARGYPPPLASFSSLPSCLTRRRSPVAHTLQNFSLAVVA